MFMNQSKFPYHSYQIKVTAFILNFMESKGRGDILYLVLRG